MHGNNLVGIGIKKSANILSLISDTVIENDMAPYFPFESYDFLKGKERVR